MGVDEFYRRDLFRADGCCELGDGGKGRDGHGRWKREGTCVLDAGQEEAEAAAAGKHAEENELTWEEAAERI